MEKYTKIKEDIYRLTIPYKDIFTTVCIIKTVDGVLLFDSASYDDDIETAIVPMLSELGILPCELKYVFVSHYHTDHAGGLAALMKKFPDLTILSRSPALKEKFSQYKFICPEENDVFLGVLKAVTIPGHTEDSCALLDERTKTLITGDCLQLYGIFGSEDWAANVSFVCEHLKAIDKLRNIDIQSIIAAHNYHPYGFLYEGEEAVSAALDACIEPLAKIKAIIRQNPELSDEAVREIYNSSDKIPTVREAVVAHVRAAKCL